MPHLICLSKYTQLRIRKQIQVKDFNWIETQNQQINLANYCGGEKILSPPQFQHCGGECPRCPRGSDNYAFSTPKHSTANKTTMEATWLQY